MPPPFPALLYAAPIFVCPLPVSHFLSYTVLLYLRVLDIHPCTSIMVSCCKGQSVCMAAPTIHSGVGDSFISSRLLVLRCGTEVRIDMSRDMYLPCNFHSIIILDSPSIHKKYIIKKTRSKMLKACGATNMTTGTFSLPGFI